MELVKLTCILILFFSFAAFIPTLSADEVLQNQSEESKAIEVADEWALLNENETNCTKLFTTPRVTHVSSNITRRGLARKRYTGPCKPTNPIDKCWRCRPNWHKDRKRLASCVIGFGRKTTGGKAGKIYVVTDPSDNDVVSPKPGTLRHAVIQKEPLWIIFQRSMTIKLKQELIMQSHKTIDGRGAKVHIAYGAGFTIQFVQNIIIHNLYIHDIVVTNGGLIRDSVDHLGLRTVSDGDGITVFGSRNVWLDHLSMYRCADGIIDIIEGSTAVTISNCHWTDHDKVLLFGARDTNVEDDYMRITVIYNHFGKRLHQRMPRVRSGFVHIINNDYTHWNMYAIGGSHHATLISQGNRFIAPPRPEFKQVTHRDAPESEWKKWTWRSDQDLFLNGAFFVQSGDTNGAKRIRGLDVVQAKPGRAVKSLTRFSGVLGGCKEGVPC
ncbi:putative pectate lyase P59 [Camellia lanceoleosa]|uniref:Pectate lyase P59 n=1 Tax=Camellia lanceoleosa TaxID=1840588 RepID=A0ACC0ISG0_9ERIC|nr:putative pectate lyase P59 [Camellia lanceoleosa]